MGSRAVTFLPNLSCYAFVWYPKFNVSYRHLAEMMRERGFEVHHTTIYRWIQTYAPQLEKLIRWYQGPHGLLVASR
jgi:transposase-like protein